MAKIFRALFLLFIALALGGCDGSPGLYGPGQQYGPPPTPGWQYGPGQEYGPPPPPGGQYGPGQQYGTPPE